MLLLGRLEPDYMHHLLNEHLGAPYAAERAAVVSARVGGLKEILASILAPRHSRSVLAGSTPAARKAGTSAAASATTNSAADAAASVIGSPGPTP